MNSFVANGRPRRAIADGPFRWSVVIIMCFVPFCSLITDFYEYGWGHSFHFAPRMRGESFDVRDLPPL